MLNTNFVKAQADDSKHLNTYVVSPTGIICAGNNSVFNIAHQFGPVGACNMNYNYPSNWGIYNGSDSFYTGATPIYTQTYIGYIPIPALTYSFVAPGTYTVCFERSDCPFFTDCKQVVVLPAAEVNVYPACAGLPTLFTATPCSTTTTYLWNFNDPSSGVNNTSTLQNPSHIYNVAGTYIASLTINGTATITKTVNILPAAQITATVVCEGNQTLFTATPCSTTTTYLWNFNDPSSGVSNTSTLQNPSHIYTTAGTYTAVLTVNGVATVNKTVVVKPKPQLGLDASSGYMSACELKDIYILNTNIALQSVNWSVIGGSIIGGQGTGLLDVQWNSNAGGSIICVAEGTNGCTKTDTFYVSKCCTGTNPRFNLTGVNTAGNALAPYATINASNIYVLTGQTFYVNGLLIIDKSFQFVNCTFIMGTNAKIEAYGSISLDIFTTKFYACEAMWDGIYAGGGIKLECGDSFFEDAHNAIYLDDNVTYNILGCRFNKNNIGIYATGPHLDAIAAHNEIRSCSFSCTNTGPFSTSNTFTGSLGMRLPFLGKISEYGIYCDDIKSMVVGKSTYGQKNNFYNLQTGYYSMFTYKNQLYNCHFENILENTSTTIPEAAINVRGSGKPVGSVELIVGGNANAYEKCTFKNCSYGIIAEKNVTAEINYNELLRIKNSGIWINNNIEANKINITNNLIEQANVGVHGTSNTNASVYIAYNQIKTNTQMFAIPMHYGVKIDELNQNNAFSIYIIKANTIDLSLLAGIQVLNTRNTTIYGNTITYKRNPNASVLRSRGIRANAVNNITIVYNVMQANNQPNAVHTDEGGAYVAMSANASVYCNTSINTGNGFGFRFDNINAGTSFNRNTMQNNRSGLILHNNGFIGAQGTTATPNDNKWMGNMSYSTYASSFTNGQASPFVTRNTGNWVSSNNNFDANSQVIVFTTTTNPTNPLFACRRKSVIPSINTYNSLMTNASNSTKQQWLNKRGFYHQLITDSVTTTDTTLIQFITATQQSNIGLIDSIQNLLVDTASANLQTAQSLNVALAAQNNIEQNSQLINELVAYVKEYDTLFTINQVDVLRNLAYKCPFEDGPAVYQARALLVSYDSLSTWYDNACEYVNIELEENNNNGKGKALIDKEKSQLNVFPNPSKGELYFNVETENEEQLTGTYEVRIYDVSGRLIIKRENAQQNTAIKLQLQPGVYILQLQGNNINKTEKLLISND